MAVIKKITQKIVNKKGVKMVYEKIPNVEPVSNEETQEQKP